MTAPPQFARGTWVDDRFEIVELIGRGGMARVFRALDLLCGDQVALKVLRPELAATPEAVERLSREASVLQRLAHPAIVSLRATGRLPTGGAYLAMELLEGHTLGQWLRRTKQLAPQELAPVVAAVCAGLHAAHREGIIHRDLKPDNIFLCELNGQVKVLDFGLSKLFGEAALTRPGELLGTPRYMAPEQLRGGGSVGIRADLYAVGVVAYEALAGRPPFDGVTSAVALRQVLAGAPPPLHTLRPDLPITLSDTLSRALAREPSDRFATALELGDALLADLAGASRGSAPTASMGQWPTQSVPRPATTGSEPRFSEGRGSDLPAESPSWMRHPRNQTQPRAADSDPIQLPVQRLGRTWWLAAAVVLLAALLWLTLR